MILGGLALANALSRRRKTPIGVADVLAATMTAEAIIGTGMPDVIRAVHETIAEIATFNDALDLLRRGGVAAADTEIGTEKTTTAPTASTVEAEAKAAA